MDCRGWVGDRGRTGPNSCPASSGFYDFTHFTAAKRCAVAVLDVVSRYWLSTVVSAEESSTQVEVAFTRALCADGKDHLLDGDLLNELSTVSCPTPTSCPCCSPCPTTARK